MTDFQTKKYEILSKKIIAPKTAFLELDGHLPFRPGQFIEANLEHIGNATLAPCSNPKDKKKFELCIKAVGNTTNKLIELLPGDHLDIRGPYGNSWKFENTIGAEIIIVTGGIGLAPLRPLLLELENKKILLSKITLICGFRSTENILFLEDLVRWKKRFQVRAIVEFSHRKSVATIGSVSDVINSTKILPNKTQVMMCGPEPMYGVCADLLLKKGMTENNIFASLERRMECGLGLCQHCSCGSKLVCQDGPIFRWDKIKNELNK